MNMGKKVNRVKVELDAGGIKQLSNHEIKTILRGADDLIMSGGRALLAKILAGSKDKKLLELELDMSPVYGAFKGQSQKEILAKIDWMILKRYLAIEYDYRLPLLVYTEKGWEIERETYADELLGKLEQAAANEEYEFVETLQERDRGLILLLLDKIEASGKKELVTILQAWKMIAYKKVKVRIDEAIDTLEKIEKEEIPLDQNEKRKHGDKEAWGRISCFPA
jgi:superfamily II DNA helicase RecQ